MLGRMREEWVGGLGRRLAAIGSGFVDTFLRDNRVIPLVLGLLALLVFAWVVAGIFLGDPDGEQVSSETNFAQSEDQPGTDPPAPELENRDAESYAAYQSKDPFRQLLSPGGETTATTPDTTTQDPTGDTTTAEPGRDGGGGSGALDTDGDGVSDQRESEWGLDPLNPDTDGDGTLDGDENSGGGPRGGGGGGDTGGGRQDGGLFNSGGDLRLP